ncbi:MAG: cytochrome c [Bacteroidales bacterium]|nr:cytochrome c [Bacteroidales bacterium]
MKRFVLILIGWFYQAHLFGGNTGEWEIPSQYTAVNNPESITIQTILNGKRIYTSTCAACHGANADGRGLIAAPGFTNTTFTKQRDGEIFYKIFTGRNQMPGFKGKLSAQQIWQVIHYLRSLTDREHYPVITLKQASIKLHYDSITNTITAIALNEQSDTLTDVLLQFFARQSFGWLPFLQKSIDNLKKIEVKVPTDIVGDMEGRLKIKVQLTGNADYMDTSAVVEVRTTLVPPSSPPFFPERTLWNIQRKSPRWLIIMSITVLAVVYGTLIYVAILLFRLRRQGHIFIK